MLLPLASIPLTWGVGSAILAFFNRGYIASKQESLPGKPELDACRQPIGPLLYTLCKYTRLNQCILLYYTSVYLLHCTINLCYFRCKVGRSYVPIYFIIINNKTMRMVVDTISASIYMTSQLTRQNLTVCNRHA